MRKYTVVFMITFFCISALLFPAIYKGKTIDEQHFPAEIRLKDSKSVYKVDVVFVGKAANIRFLPQQFLPAEARSNVFMTLYLENETIDNAGRVRLKQVKPPPDLDDSKPEDWEAANIWIMNVDLSSIK